MYLIYHTSTQVLQNFVSNTSNLHYSFLSFLSPLSFIFRFPLEHLQFIFLPKPKKWHLTVSKPSGMTYNIWLWMKLEIFCVTKLKTVRNSDFMKDLRFSQRSYWRLRSPDVWRLVTWRISLDVSKALRSTTNTAQCCLKTRAISHKILTSGSLLSTPYQC